VTADSIVDIIVHAPTTADATRGRQLYDRALRCVPQEYRGEIVGRVAMIFAPRRFAGWCFSTYIGDPVTAPNGIAAERAAQPMVLHPGIRHLIVINEASIGESSVVPTILHELVHACLRHSFDGRDDMEIEAECERHVALWWREGLEVAP
jgi:hypothetical protein